MNDLSLLDQAFLDLAELSDQTIDKIHELPSDWIEKHFWVPRPRDPETGEFAANPGPIRLKNHQKRILNEALSRNLKGQFKYTTIVYSAPKKSGKSALTSAVGLYLGDTTPYAQIYCLANDGVQSKDRLYLPMWTCLNFHKQKGLKLEKARANLLEAFLPNFSNIRAVPVDASGEAGSEPTATLWSELHGFTDEAKRRLWAEMTVPPTLWGHAIRWVESYAGYIGVSDLLWDLYHLGVKEGVPHPDFTDLEGRDGESVVWVNERAHLFCYWDTVGRMPWQQGEAGAEFYQQESHVLPPAELQRMHFNQWVSGSGTYIQPEWWDACADPSIVPLPVGSNVPVVVGVDAAISGDCAALVVVSRHPVHVETDIAVRYCKIFKPEPGRNINIERDIGSELRKICKRWNVICVAYDAYQMESLIQNYKRGQIVVNEEETRDMNLSQAAEYVKAEGRVVQKWYYKFGQQQPRAVADKRLYDMVMSRQVHWNPDDLDSDIAEKGNKETLSKHIKQAGSKTSSGQMRIEKLSNDAKIDSAVALSMASHRCMSLNIGNTEMNTNDLVRKLQRGEITLQQFEETMQLRQVAMRTRNG